MSDHAVLAEVQSRPERETWISALRCWAAVAVVALHVSAGYLQTPGSYQWHVANIVDAVSRPAVPIFVMISGYLLLDPARSPRFSRAFRMLALCAFWSAVYAIYRLAIEGNNPSIGILLGDIKGFLLAESYYHLWYLYMAVGLYLATPFLSTLIQYLTKRHLYLLIFFSFCWGGYEAFVPSVPSWLVAPGYIGYFILGRVIGDGRLPLSLSTATLMAAIGSLATIFGTIATATMRTSASLEYVFYGYMSPTVIAAGVGIFGMLSRWSTRSASPANVLVRMLADCSLGIYVLHPMFISLIGTYLKAPDPLLEIVLLSGTAIVGSLAVTLALKPVLSKFSLI